ncbi:MAG: DUF3857 domain-containing protein [Acidobacteria bacterium]|nr:DUF3857 domain-containing protein [Acidobacteriota bacterium]
MRRTLKAGILAVAIAGVAGAGVTSFEKNLKPDPARGMQDAVILLDKGTIDDTFTDRLSRVTYLRRMKIFTHKGIDEWGTVKLTFDPQVENIGHVKATVWNPDGSVHELEDKDVHFKKVSKEWGLKLTEISFALPGLTEDSIVEYSYYRSYKWPQRFYIWHSQYPIYCLRSEVTFIPWPANRWGFMGANMHARPQVERGRHAGNDTGTAVMTDIPALPEEEYSPAYGSRAEYVGFYYSDSNIKYDDFWLDYGKVYFRSNLHSAMKSCSATRKIAASELAGLSPEEKLKAAYYYVIKHFTPLDAMSKADQAKVDKHYFEKLVKADHPGEMVKLPYLMNSQMNCVLASLIHAALEGAQVRYVFYCPWNKRLFAKPIHTFAQFDGSMLQVTLNGKVYWLAPATKLLPANETPYGARGVPLLVLGRDGARFEKLDPRPSSEVVTDISTDITLGEDQVRIKRTTTYNPYKSFALRTELEYYTDDEIADVLKERLKDAFGSDAQLESQHVQNLKDPAKPLVIQEEFTLPFDLDDEAETILFRLVGLSSRTTNPFNAQKRYANIFFPYCYQKKQHVVYHLPENLTVGSVPAPEHAHALALTFRTQATKIDDHTFSVTTFEELRRNMYAAAAHSELKRVYDRIIALSNPTVVLKAAE